MLVKMYVIFVIATFIFTSTQDVQKQIQLQK